MTVAVALPPLRRLPRSISPAVPLAVPPRVGRPRTRGWPVRWAAASLSLSLARVLAQRRWSWTTPGVRGRFGRAGIELRIRVILLAEERRDIHWSWSSCERHAEAGQPTGQCSGVLVYIRITRWMAAAPCRRRQPPASTTTTQSSRSSTAVRRGGGQRRGSISVVV
jgi:hypothetical protein